MKKKVVPNKSDPNPSGFGSEGGVPVTTEMRHYVVPISSTVEMHMTGSISVVAASEAAAVSEAEYQMSTPDVGDIEMEDEDTGFRLPYAEVEFLGHGIDVDYGAVEVGEVVTPEEALEAELDDLFGAAPKDAETFNKIKAFLQALSPQSAAA